jgi:molybdenum cofactor biosynthesis enzyme MoaA
MVNHYRDRNLVAWVDLSTYCNAGCPQCHRTNPIGLDKVDWLPLTQWSINEFKQAFSIADMAKIRRFEICGTWGDPFMAKDIFEISKYIMENSNAWLQINTNGGMRDDEFWWEYGLLTRGRSQIIFDVEGINQEMHSHYRRKVDFEKLKSHIQNFTAAGGNAMAHIILFKHNENYVQQIIDMCYNELGVQSHLVQASNRFFTGTTEEFIDENGTKFVLEEATKTDFAHDVPTAPLRDHKWWENVGKDKVAHGLWTPKNDTKTKQK